MDSISSLISWDAGREWTNSLITSSGCNSTWELSDLFQVHVFNFSRSLVFMVAFSLFFSISPRCDVVTNELMSGWAKAVKTSQWFLCSNNLFTTHIKRSLLVILRYSELQLGLWSVFCVVMAIKTSGCMRSVF